jgi:enolase
MSSKIQMIEALEVLDSRGNPTVEATVYLENGVIASAIAPSGASTGTKEACELRDGDKSRFGGKGTLKAVCNIEGEIAQNLIGVDATRTRLIDEVMINLDGTENKSRLGANAILAVSIASAKAGAISCNLPLFQFLGGTNAHVLPVPMMNIINGGVHASSGLAIQEFMIMPISATSISEAIRMGSEVFNTLKKELHNKGFSTNVGDEGGFAPNLKNSNEALDLICSAVEKSGYKLGEDIMFALDCASTEFYKNGQYEIDGQSLFAPELVEYYDALLAKYPIFSIEDAFAESDYAGFKEITQKLGSKIQIVGDDLFCTNSSLLQKGMEDGLANALLVKFNQIGTISETLDAISIAHRGGYNCIASHRSGESEDVTISHLAVATNCGQIKTGSLARTDRTAKYNELMRIEKALGSSAFYAGKSILSKFHCK